MNVGEAVVKEVIKQGQKYFLDKENQLRSSHLEQIRRFYRSAYSDGGQVEVKIPTWFECDKSEIPIRTATAASIRSPPVKEGAYYGNLYKDQYFRIRHYQEEQTKTIIRSPNLSSTRMLVSEEYKEWAQHKLSVMRADSPDELREVECRITFLNYLTRDNHLFNSGNILFPDRFRAVLRSCMIDLETIREEMQARLQTSAALTDLERLYTNDCNLFGEICMFVCLAFRNTQNLQLGHMKSLVDEDSSLYRAIEKTSSGKHLIAVANTLKNDLEDNQNETTQEGQLPFRSPKRPHRVPVDLKLFFAIDDENELPNTSSAVMGYNIPRSGITSYFLKRQTKRTWEGMKSFLEIHQVLQNFATVINFVKDAIDLAKFGGDLLIYGLASVKLIAVMQKHATLFHEIKRHMQTIYRAMRSYLDDHIINKTNIDKHWQINQAYADGHYLNLFSGSDCMFQRCARDADLITERAQQPFSSLLERGCSKTEYWIRNIDNFFKEEAEKEGSMFDPGDSEAVLEDLEQFKKVALHREQERQRDQKCHIIDYNTDPPQFMVFKLNSAKGGFFDKISRSVDCTVLVVGDYNSGKSSLIHALGCIPKDPKKLPHVNPQINRNTVASFYLTPRMILIDLPVLDTQNSDWITKKVDTALLVVNESISHTVKALYYNLKSLNVKNILIVRNKIDLESQVDLTEIHDAFDVTKDTVFLTNCRGFDPSDPCTYSLDDGVVDLMTALSEGTTQIQLLWQYYTQGRNKPFAVDKEKQQERIESFRTSGILPQQDLCRRFRIHLTPTSEGDAREWWSTMSSTLIMEHNFDKGILEDFERCLFHGKRRYYGSRLDSDEEVSGFFNSVVTFSVDVIHILSINHRHTDKYEIFVSVDQISWRFEDPSLIGQHYIEFCDYASYVCRYEDITFLESGKHRKIRKNTKRNQEDSINELKYSPKENIPPQNHVKHKRSSLQEVQNRPPSKDFLLGAKKKGSFQMPTNIGRRGRSASDPSESPNMRVGRKKVSQISQTVTSKTVAREIERMRTDSSSFR